jgi:hypothetical protein
MTDSRGELREQAKVLRLMATQLGEHGVGQRWQGPARRHCEAQLMGLEEDLFSAARRLDAAAHYAGVHTALANI